MTYSAAILELFSNPNHAGVLEGDDVVSQGVVSQMPFSNLTFYVRLDANKNVQEISFQCSSTPLLIAVAEYICRKLEGQRLSHTKDLSNQAIIDELEISPNFSHIIIFAIRLVNLLKNSNF